MFFVVESLSEREEVFGSLGSAWSIADKVSSFFCVWLRTVSISILFFLAICSICAKKSSFVSGCSSTGFPSEIRISVLFFKLNADLLLSSSLELSITKAGVTGSRVSESVVSSVSSALFSFSRSLSSAFLLSLNSSFVQ